MTFECTQVSPECPVDQTIYGYYPSLGANGFFAAAFAVLFIANLGLGYMYKTWTYMLAMTLACASEAIGYGGRIMLHENPWSNTGFIMQICCINIGPAFNCAAIYLTLKHLTLTFGPEWSRIRPAWYTWIFISSDISALILQAVGGALASTADYSTAEGQKQLSNGDHISLAGTCWQVATLGFFGIASAEYIIRRVRATKTTPFSLKAQRTLEDSRFRAFVVAIMTAYVFILARCIYRIVEFVAGWGNPIQQNQAAFIALEGVMIVLATLSMTVCHPGFCFPALSSRKTPEVDTTYDEKLNASVTSGYVSSGSENSV